MKNKCEYCGVDAGQQCAGCKLVFYCGREHQILDWKRSHRSKCKCYEVSQSNQPLHIFLLACGVARIIVKFSTFTTR